MSRDFQFKQFTISQPNAPMKVGTDGVLLGAWCHCNNRSRALDIGTGTGLIALMLAQKCKALHIIAIEPNTDAWTDAALNFKNSNWKNRIELHQLALEDFNPKVLFDLIISNPPFFHGALQTGHTGRNMARHVSGFDFEALLDCTKWLSPNGVIAGIYPIEIFEQMHTASQKHGLFLHRVCYVKPTPEKAPHRVLFEFSQNKIDTLASETLVVESDGRHQYSAEYRALTQVFYLNF